MPRARKPGVKAAPPARDPLDEATDRLFLRGDDNWPAYPVLPVKHKRETDAKGFPKLGCLLAFDKQTIYLTNMYDADFDNCEKLTFTDRESMILNGWVVN